MKKGERGGVGEREREGGGREYAFVCFFIVTAADAPLAERRWQKGLDKGFSTCTTSISRQMGRVSTTKNLRRTLPLLFM